MVPVLSTLAAPVLAAGVLLAPATAEAQVVIVRPAPPPPPPPPPRAYVYPYGYPYGYGAPPPPPPAYYYVDREPAYALQLGADLEGAAPVGVNVPQDGTLKGGGGFKVRLGEQFRLAGVRLTPEIGFGYDNLWANDALGNTYTWDMNRVFAGARLSFGRLIVPVIYGHVGYGWRQTSEQYVTSGTGGLAYDVGGALDLRVIPHFGFGVHLEYAAIDIPTQPQWVAAGLHADILF